MFKRDNPVDENQVVEPFGTLQALGQDAVAQSFENELSDLWQPDADEKKGAGAAPEIRLMEQGRISSEQLEQARRSDRHQHWREVNDLKRELEELQRLADGEREMPGSYRGIGA